MRLADAHDELSPAVREIIAATAEDWTNAYWDGPGYADLSANGGHRDARPFELLAALVQGHGRCRWGLFVTNTIRDVLGPHPNFERIATLRRELDGHLRRVSREARDDPPHYLWLAGAYWYAFTYYRLPQPPSLPSWWDEVLGPYVGPHPPEPPPEPEPPDTASLPTETHLDKFVPDESQGNVVLEEILAGLANETVALVCCDQRMTALTFTYLRYRNAPCLQERAPTPRSNELVPHLVAIGFGTESSDVPIAVNNLDQMLVRLRKIVRPLLRAAVRAGRLNVDEAWIALAFPNPLHYTYGHLFAPLPPNQPITDDRGSIGGTP
jgi:hypothetical protein